MIKPPNPALALKPLLNAYDSAMDRVNKARSSVVTPFVSTDMARILGAGAAIGGAVAQQIRQSRVTQLNLDTSALKGNRQPTLTDAQRVAEQVAAVSHAWSNFWRIDVRERTPASSKEVGKAARLLELLARDVSFGSRTITAEPIPLGAAQIDKPSGSQGTQIRVTTGDDTAGTLQRWFEAKADQVARPDGTFGLPSDYLMAITITRLERNPSKPGVVEEAFSRDFLVRPASCEEEYARMTPELLQVTLVFDPFDTFFPTQGIV